MNLYVRHVMLLAALSALAACSTSDTRIQLEVTADATWGIDQYQIRVGAVTALASALPELEVVVPDDIADQTVSLEVWGLSAGKQVAYDDQAVTPVLHSSVNAAVTLAAVSCGTWCTLGAVECANDGTITCQMQSNGCLGWSPSAACPTDEPFCSNGMCAAQCSDECTVGQTTCDSSGVRTCGQFDSDPCLDWSPTMDCPNGETCSNGVCGTPVACANDGDSCDDGNACTTNDRCAVGTCSGTPKCTAAPANADPTCAADGTCGFTCHPGFEASGSSCLVEPRLIFISSIRTDGNLGGLTGADAFCQHLANSPGTFKAWLSDSQTSAADRLTHSTGPYKLVDGSVVAEDWDALTSGTLMHAISVDENGNAPSPIYAVWTDTTASGALWASGEACADWTSDAVGDLAGIGAATATSSWSLNQVTELQSTNCNYAYAQLYCVEQ